MYIFLFIENPLFWLGQNKSFLGSPSVVFCRGLQCNATFPLSCSWNGMWACWFSIWCLDTVSVAICGEWGELDLQEHCRVLFCASPCVVTLQVNACAVWPASTNGASEHPSCVRPTVCFPPVSYLLQVHLGETVRTAHILVLGTSWDRTAVCALVAQWTSFT